jgi:hypothetical protein
MNRPASLADLSHFDPYGSGALLSTIALALRQGFLITRCLQGQPTVVRTAARRHPTGIHSLRLIRSDGP